MAEVIVKRFNFKDGTVETKSREIDSKEVLAGNTLFQHLAKQHYSSCAVHNAPALPVGPCDCGGYIAPDKDCA